MSKRGRTRYVASNVTVRLRSLLLVFRRAFVASIVVLAASVSFAEVASANAAQKKALYAQQLQEYQEARQRYEEVAEPYWRSIADKRRVETKSAVTAKQLICKTTFWFSLPGTPDHPDLLILFPNRRSLPRGAPYRSLRTSFATLMSSFILFRPRRKARSSTSAPMRRLP